MKLPKETKEQLRDFGYLLLGYITVIVLLIVSICLGKLWSPLEMLFYVIFGFLVCYPLGNSIANWFKSILKD
ncbi:hypothetical protein [Heyndrickxia camelliae]|uniref:Uncharacterized protein n=1 Tax=Heyndrickxia camelliae TaxID=1707093 RepID=A0A2N3LCS3_9BACI|nr:hypothetical protein [Heyndrickxia camelliae]PKR82462.1 hypothetical protein CWO92_24295 [Heyndrickxia camelliae]